jgi:hypothetical protein
MCDYQLGHEVRRHPGKSTSAFYAVMLCVLGMLFLLLSSSHTIGEALIAWGTIFGLDIILEIYGVSDSVRRRVRISLGAVVLCGACVLLYIGCR